jgi:hypothetical protein
MFGKFGIFCRKKFQEIVSQEIPKKIMRKITLYKKEKCTKRALEEKKTLKKPHVTHT